MPDLAVRVVDVYPYRSGAGGAEWLVLRRAPGRAYAGQWRMVGGKIGPNETAHAAARRELEEETGQAPAVLWTIPSANVFYEWAEDRVNVVPAFAAELRADPVLDAEHDAWAWLPAPEAAARLAWPEQRRLLRLADTLLREGLRPEWTVG
jgi:dihydroneopterin triphosphate diphosphatase